MKRSGPIPALASVALATVSAELAVRLLSPAEPPPRPEPVDIHSHFSAAEIARGRRYARPQQAIGLLGALIDAAALVAIVARRSHSPRSRPVDERWPAGALSGAALSIVLSVPGLPLAALARQRALSVGLATQSWADWAGDRAKAAAIESTLAAGAGAAVVTAMRRWPRHWWLPAAAGSVLLGALAATVAPIVLEPIFNDFTPLPDGETRDDVLALARQAGVSVARVQSVDASRRTTAANAYVAGLGPTKRVVLFDTLLERFSREEVRVVVAHELAHVRHRDVLRGLGFAAVTAPATAHAVQRVGSAISGDRGGRALPALTLAAGLVSFPVSLSARRLSRAIERRADAFSLRLSGAPEAFVSFERAIALQNVADVDPPRIASLLSTHPPTGERIAAALAHGRTA